MEEFRVPTTPVDAEIQLLDGRMLRGTVFVPASASVHSGPERMDEWINEATPFFAFRPEGTQGADLLGKRSVVRLSVPAAAAGDEAATREVQRTRVVIECPGGRFEGDIRLDMPDHQRRVLDYVNQPGAFISLHVGATVHLIQKSLVVRIIQKAG